MKLLPKNFFHRVINFYLNKQTSVAKDIKIGNLWIGRNHPCFFIAEVGINHNGDIDIAKKLIDAAVVVGCQAVKFQKRTVPAVYSADELAKPRAVDRGVLEGAVRRGVLSKESVERLKRSDFKDSTNGDLKWALEFTTDEYGEIDRYCKEKGIIWFASPWDEGSVDFLEQFDPPCYKVASAMLTHQGILRKIKTTGRPAIVSTGMSTMEEIKRAVEVLSGVPLILLHTVSTYPANDNEINLRMIVKLKKEFPDIPIGYSGHENGIGISLAAATLGAHVIERHITLDRKMFGTDQGASLEPADFARLIKEVNGVRIAFGDGIKKVLPSEIPIREKLRKK